MYETEGNYIKHRKNNKLYGEVLNFLTDNRTPCKNCGRYWGEHHGLKCKHETDTNVNKPPLEKDITEKIIGRYNR